MVNRLAGEQRSAWHRSTWANRVDMMSQVRRLGVQDLSDGFQIVCLNRLLITHPTRDPMALDFRLNSRRSFLLNFRRKIPITPELSKLVLAPKSPRPVPSNRPSAPHRLHPYDHRG